MATARAQDARDSRRHQRGGAISTLLGGGLLVLVGFAAGLVVGASFEDPDLVADALAGRGTEVPLPETAAPPPAGEPAGAAPAPLGARARQGDPPPPVGARARQGDPPPPVAAAPPPRVAPPPAAPPAARGDFSVQVGAFAEEGPARGLVRQLESRGFRAFVLSENRRGPWRVRVGPVATREEADGLARRLKRDEGLPTWVVSDG